MASGGEMESLNKLQEEAQDAYDMRLYELAVEKYGQVAQLLGKVGGKDYADVLVKYGRALLDYAVQQGQVLGGTGEKTLEVVPVPEIVKNDAKTGVVELSDDEQETEAVNEEGEDEGNEEEEEEEEEEADDFMVAWEVLEIARVIYLQHPVINEVWPGLGDAFTLLGDVSMEIENFEQAEKEYTEAVQVWLKHAGENDRRLAEARYKIALAREYAGRKEEAIEQLKLVAEVLQRRISSEGEERQDLQALLKEIETKMEDLKEEPEAVTTDLPSSNATKRTAEVEVNDITNLVRKKRPPPPSPSTNK